MRTFVGFLVLLLCSTGAVGDSYGAGQVAGFFFWNLPRTAAPGRREYQASRTTTTAPFSTHIGILRTCMPQVSTTLLSL